MVKRSDNQWQMIKKNISLICNEEETFFNEPPIVDKSYDIMFIALSLVQEYENIDDRTCWHDYSEFGKNFHKMAEVLLPKIYPNQLFSKTFSEYFWNTNIIKTDSPDHVVKRGKKYVYPTISEWLPIIREEIAYVKPKIIVLFGGKVRNRLYGRRGKIHPGRVLNEEAPFFIESYMPTARNGLFNKKIPTLIQVIELKYNQD